jgi:hypothetical protein
MLVGLRPTAIVIPQNLAERKLVLLLLLIDCGNCLAYRFRFFAQAL